MQPGIERYTVSRCQGSFSPSSDGFSVPIDSGSVGRLLFALPNRSLRKIHRREVARNQSSDGSRPSIGRLAGDAAAVTNPVAFVGEIGGELRAWRRRGRARAEAVRKSRRCRAILYSSPPEYFPREAAGASAPCARLPCWPGERHDDAGSRHPLCAQAFRAATCLRGRGRALAGHRHWREHGALQRHACTAAEPAALRPRGSARHPLEPLARPEHHGGLVLDGAVLRHPEQQRELRRRRHRAGQHDEPHR